MNNALHVCTLCILEKESGDILLLMEQHKCLRNLVILM